MKWKREEVGQKWGAWKGVMNDSVSMSFTVTIECEREYIL